MSFGLVVGGGVLIYLTLAVRKVIARKAEEEAVGLTVGDGEFIDDEDLEQGGVEDLWNADAAIERGEVSPSLFTNDFYFGDSSSRSGAPLVDRGPS